MDKEDLKFIEYWGKVRKRGLIMYFLRNEAMCIMGWFIGAILGLIIKGTSLPTLSYIVNETYISLIRLLTGGVIGTFLWWYLKETRYKELMKYKEGDI